ncbi:MAG TPA: hypothetical protein VLM85_05530 [Polyangiaceae bacterium]|nr:hypothetical protein [Polyangiaceae bacterium]
MAAYEVSWDESSALLTTRTRSPIGLADVFRFKETLAETLARVPALTSFLWMSSAVGYHPHADRAAHQELRSVVPATLAAHGVRTSLLDLVEDADVTVSRTRGIVCRAIAHVHHDAGKMLILDERFGRPNERYFSNEALAVAWLALQ